MAVLMGQMKLTQLFLYLLTVRAVDIHPLDPHHYPFHHREGHPSKILFQSHTLDTERHANIVGQYPATAKGFMFSAVSWVGKLFNFAASPSDDQPAQEQEPRIMLVQLKPDVSSTSELRKEIEEHMGLELGGYLPHNTYVVYGPRSVVAKALSHSAVRWVGAMPERAKLVGDTLRLLHLHPIDSADNCDWSEEQCEHHEQLLAHSPWLRDKQMLARDDALLNGLLNVSLVLELAAPAPQRTREDAELLAQQLQTSLLSDPPASLDNAQVTARKDQLHVKLAFRPSAARTGDLARLVRLLAKEPQVYAIETHALPKITNMLARGLVQNGNKNGDTPIFDTHGLQGQGEIIGVADSGLDWDHCFFSDYSGSTNTPFAFSPNSENNPSARKVLAYHRIGDADYKDDPDGHGTHVTGSIAGAPPNALNSALAEYGGTAPAAKLIFADVGTEQGLVGLSGDTNVGRDILQVAYDEGARIHSNSWGSSTPDYTNIARSIDIFVWNHPDMLVLVAAGNDGVKPGVITGTVGSPATMKNGLAIGASQTTNQGWSNSLDFTDWDAKERQAEQQIGPISDCCSHPNVNVQNYCCKTKVEQGISGTGPAGAALHNEECMADFSSRGPTLDGRIKPELVAPGQFIISARSDGLQNTPKLSSRTGIRSECWKDQCCAPAAGSADKSASDLLSMAGTSMATPVSAGAAALVREYLRKGYYPSGEANASNVIASPRASLLVALMANGAHTLTGKIDLNNDGSQYVSLSDPGVWPIKQIFQGFGRLDLSESLHFKNSNAPERPDLYLDHSETADTNSEVVYRVVSASTTTIKATLAWSDYPGELNTNLTSVNNLDLIMGSSTSNAVAGNFKTLRDTKNNIEHAFFTPTRTGEIVYIMIRGYNVPKGPQPFSVVISGDFTNVSGTLGASKLGKCNYVNCTAEFVVPKDYFMPAGDAEHFPYGPVIGGVAGALSFLAILIYVVKWYLEQKRAGGGGVLDAVAEMQAGDFSGNQS
eukprot:g53373.t1